MWHAAESMYPYLPLWAQNAGISLYGAFYRKERLGGSFDQYVEEFKARERWPAATMRDYLDQSLAHLLVRAFEQSPYYRQRFRSAGFTKSDLARFTLADLPRLPVTPKDDVRRDPYAFVADDMLKTRLHTYYSSGSTGTPITCVYSTRAHRLFYAAREARSFAWAGTSIRAKRSMIGGRLVLPDRAGPPCYRYNYAERQVYFSAFHISASNIDSYAEGLNRFRPELLTGYAHAHYVLSRLMCERGLSLSYEPKAAVLGSEQLTPEMKAIIRRALRVRAWEEYGCVENCALATECEAGSLHVHPDFGIVEIVDSKGEPAREGSILCTGLLNDAQFLIRYAINDSAAWADRPCGCGRDQLPALRELFGRDEDAVVTPDGRETVRLHGLFIHLPAVIEGQVIQEEIDLFRVRVVASSAFSLADRCRIEERVHERLGDVRVIVEQVAELPRTARGKLRAVISHLANRPHMSQVAR